MDKNWNVEKMAAEVRTQKRPSAQAYAWFVTGWKKTTKVEIWADWGQPKNDHKK